MKLSIQNIFYILASLGLLITGLVMTKTIMAPIVFAILIALALAPICSKFESFGVNKLFSIVITFLSLTIVIGLVITIFSVTFANIYKELPEIQGKIDAGLSTVENKVSEWTGLSDENIENRLQENKSKVLAPLWKFVEGSLSASFVVIGNVFMTALYTFLLLYYRKGIRQVFFRKLDKDQKQDRSELFDEIQEVIKSYALSILIVILVLGIINSLGLWIIGIDYPIFWGFLAGFLVIIPYIGTTLGGILPFLYALATTDTLWQPAAIVIMYFTVQQIEGNLITPNIVGSKIQVNAMTVILAMIFAGVIWGLSGLILALPVVAVLRTIFVRYENTKNIGLLMSTSVSE